MGKLESGEIVDRICKAVEEKTDLAVIKVDLGSPHVSFVFLILGALLQVIREFIASDDNKQLDAGWLEPLPTQA